MPCVIWSTEFGGVLWEWGVRSWHHANFAFALCVNRNFLHTFRLAVSLLAKSMNMGQAKHFKIYLGFVLIRHSKICRHRNDGHERKTCKRTSTPYKTTHGSTRINQEAERARGKAWATSLSYSGVSQGKMRLAELGLLGLNNFRRLWGIGGVLISLVPGHQG